MFAALGLVLVLICATPGRSEASTPELAEARRLVEVELRYREAVDLLERIIIDQPLSARDRLEAHRLLGIACVARGAIPRAEAAFRAVLEIDPEFTIDEGVSPKIQEVVTRVKAELARAPKILELAATPGTNKVLFEASLRDPDERLASVSIYARTDNGAYRRWPMTRDGNHASVTVDMGARGKDEGRLSRVEYYAVGFGADGAPLSRVGDEARPSALVVARTLDVVEPPEPPEPPERVEVEGESRPTKWYASWWFWALVAGAAAVGTTAALVATRSGRTEGTLDPIEVP